MINRKELPKNLEIEGELLGLMIKKPLIRNDSLSRLKKEDFFLEEHQIVFETIYKLNKRNAVIDVYIIWDNIKIHNFCQEAELWSL